ncbi:MAG: hypothetical protein JST00_30250 [Deltaproteobacteria bacterium]|nr:hypothetical protein [Deltaproteobacteria bacterium]
MRAGSPLASTLVALATPLALAAACNPEGPPPAAPVELSVPPLASAAAAATSGGAASSRTDASRCSARLVADTIQTPSGCELDERLTKGPGQLLFPCRGDGTVEAVFDEHRFEGAVQGGVVVLHLRTELEWHDKCLWETKQELRGPLQTDGAHAQPGVLIWTYSERSIKVGPRGSCDTACRARAEVSVE